MSELSIGIVTKDRPEILEETLSRLEELGLTEKVIVVDGSESTRTENVCNKLGVEHHHQKAGRRIAARNELLEYCETEYLAYIDDDVLVSDSWYDKLKATLEREGVVGATGKLLDQDIPMGFLAAKFRALLSGGRDNFGEIKNNGVINGDFFYDEEKEVDHAVGCNMAFETETLRDVDGFDEEFDVGNAYREETTGAYKIRQDGRIIYNPEASLEHLAVGGTHRMVDFYFYDLYLTKYFLRKYDIVKGVKGRTEYMILKLPRHLYYLLRSVSELNTGYLYYICAELCSFLDFVLLDKEPREYF